MLDDMMIREKKKGNVENGSFMIDEDIEKVLVGRGNVKTLIFHFD